jgi:predicted cation transporter
MHWSTEYLPSITSLQTIIILIALLAGPLIFAPLEHNLEPYCLALGMIAVTVNRQWEWQLVRHALVDALPITLTVIAAGLLFGALSSVIDAAFERMRRRLPRPLLVMVVVLALGLVSSVITAIVAALILAEGINLMGLGPAERTRVVVLGCLAIGLGSALTPIGEPLATLASSAMELGFYGLFHLLAPWVIPAIAGLSAVAAYAARGPYDLIAANSRHHQRPMEAVRQGIRVFAFIIGLIFVGEACAPLASRYLRALSNEALFWVNTISAALDNATLVAVEFHQIGPERAQMALLSLLISGGMLIPGNVPNIVCANKLGMRSGEWARTGLPVGLIALGICFALLLVIG